MRFCFQLRHAVDIIPIMLGGNTNTFEVTVCKKPL